MYADEWEHVKPTDTHILWTTGSANLACLCGNYIVISNGTHHTCKLCGRVYQLDVRVLVKAQHYVIIGGYTKKPIGCTWGEEGKSDVLREEPLATFEVINQAMCPICGETK